MDKFSVLQQYFGHSSFRPGQEQVVDAIVSGQDVLGVMPTGAGKSVCYQVPAMLMPGLTLVISPLISLMQDQVAALEEEGVHAACLNSALPEGLYSTILRAALEGDYKILYVAPERLLTDSFLYLAMHARIAFVAVDEAHCVSQWGQDFRPSYLKIAEFISRLPYRPVIGAFTATATEQVKQDIIALLQLNQPFTLTTGFDRPNDSLAHFSDLAVSALTQNKFKNNSSLFLRNNIYITRSSFSAIDFNSVSHFFKHFIVNTRPYRNTINLCVIMLWMSKCISKRTVISENKKSLTVFIKPADRINPCIAIHKVHYSFSSKLIGYGCNISTWLI